MNRLLLVVTVATFAMISAEIIVITRVSIDFAWGNFYNCHRISQFTKNHRLEYYN